MTDNTNDPRPRANLPAGRSYAAAAGSSSVSATSTPVMFPACASEFEKKFFDPLNVLPDRPCSANFQLPEDSNLDDVFTDLANIGIPASAVLCAQSGHNRWMCLTFTTEVIRNNFLRKSVFIPHETRSEGMRDGRTFIAVYGAPFELPDTALMARFKKYGTVDFVRRSKLPTRHSVSSGIRVVALRMVEVVPSYLRFGRYLLRVKHDGQTATCRKCNRPGHQAASCSNVLCFNCDELGHESPQCTAAKRCCICHDTGHLAADCPFSWRRRPARERDAPAAEDRPTAAGAPPPGPVPSSPAAPPPSPPPSIPPSLPPSSLSSSSTSSSSSSSTSSSSSSGLSQDSSDISQFTSTAPDVSSPVSPSASPATTSSPDIIPPSTGVPVAPLKAPAWSDSAPSFNPPSMSASSDAALVAAAEEAEDDGLCADAAAVSQAMDVVVVEEASQVLFDSQPTQDDPDDPDMSESVCLIDDSTVAKVAGAWKKVVGKGFYRKPARLDSSSSVPSRKATAPTPPVGSRRKTTNPPS